VKTTLVSIATDTIPLDGAWHEPDSGTAVRGAVLLFHGNTMNFYTGAPRFLPPVLAALAMSREDEQQTILQVYVSSITAHEYLLGKILAGMVTGLTQCLLSVGLMLTLFGLSFAGDPTPLVAGSVLYVFCVVAFGTLVGGAIPNQAAAVQAVSLGGFLLSFLLSGLIFPIENIPDALRWVSNLVQARYYVVVVRDAFLQGGGWPAVWWAVLAIGVIGLVFYTLAWRAMRRMQVKA